MEELHVPVKVTASRLHPQEEVLGEDGYPLLICLGRRHILGTFASVGTQQAKYRWIHFRGNILLVANPGDGAAYLEVDVSAMISGM